jgi:hypothetical protein
MKTSPFAYSYKCTLEEARLAASGLGLSSGRQSIITAHGRVK